MTSLVCVTPPAGQDGTVPFTLAPPLSSRCAAMTMLVKVGDYIDVKRVGAHSCKGRNTDVRGRFNVRGGSYVRGH